MEKLHRIIVDLAVVFMLLSSGFMMFQTAADDQPAQRISSLVNYPSGVTFNGIAWKQTDYSYAIAVGTDSFGYEVVYRYSSLNSTWTPIWEPSRVEDLHDVVYDTFANNDTFLIAADNGGESDVHVIYDANAATPVVKCLQPNPVGDGYAGACFDADKGPQGTFVAVGTPYGTAHGVIAWHDMAQSATVWSEIYLPKGDMLEAVTVNPSSSSARVIAVGHNETTGKAIAYALDYEKLTKLAVPPDAKAFHGIDWQPGGNYAIVAGEDTGGHGKLWRMNFYDTIHISYYIFAIKNSCDMTPNI